MASNKKPRKAYRKKENRTDTVTLAIAGACVMSLDERLARMAIVTESFERFMQARADKKQAKDVLDVYNVMIALAGTPGVLKGDVWPFMRVCADVLEAIAERRSTTGSLATKADEREVLRALLALFDQVLENVPQRVIYNAECAVIKRIDSKNGVTNLEKKYNLIERIAA